MARLKYNPKTNRWETSEVPVPSGQDITAGDGQPWGWSDVAKTTTTTEAPKPTTPTTMAPKTTATTTAPKPQNPRQTGGSQNTRATSNVPAKVAKREPLAYNPKIAKPADTQGLLADAVAAALKDGDGSGLLALLLGDSASGGGGGATGPSEAQLRQQRVGAAKKAGGQAVKMGKQFYGQQQEQANTAIDAATQELLANLGQPTAYSNLPLVNVPPALQGLQQNLLAYGATGQQAMGQQAEDQQTSDMYTALARRGAEQMGQAETGYFDALKRAAVGAQAAGKQGVATNVADLQNQILMGNIQALLRASQ